MLKCVTPPLRRREGAGEGPHLLPEYVATSPCGQRKDRSPAPTKGIAPGDDPGDRIVGSADHCRTHPAAFLKRGAGGGCCKLPAVVAAVGSFGLFGGSWWV